MLRGSSILVQTPQVRAARRFSYEPTTRNLMSGCRPARTIQQ